MRLSATLGPLQHFCCFGSSNSSNGSGGGNSNIEMHRLNKSQKDKVSQFKSITGANDRVAQSCLQVALT